MSSSDPRMSDPRLSDPRDYRRPEFDRATGDVNAVWGWVAAAVFVAAVLLFVFASNTNAPSTNAGNGVSMPPTASAPNLPPAQNRSETTGAAPRTPAPAAPIGVAK
jgi:hypothetical protein